MGLSAGASPLQPPLIVTDSTCDLPEELYAHYDIRMIPVKMHVGEDTYLGGQGITREQLFERLAKSDTLPTTSPPTAEEIAAKYREWGADGRPILSLHPSVGLSRTVLRAEEAARQLPGQTIRVWNSQMVSAALGLQVLTAARAAQAGRTIDQIIPLIQETYRSGNIMFCIDDLTYLFRGGRIGRVSYYVAQTLNLKPIVKVSKAGDTEGTYISGSERPHSMKGAPDALVREVCRAVPPSSALRVVTLSASPAQLTLAEELYAKLREQFNCVWRAHTCTNLVISVYTGTSGVGLAFAAGDWPF